jgi:hypothetical protein
VSENNRREHERVAAAVKLIVKSLDDDSHLVTSETESLDISESGILLNSDTDLPNNLPVKMELHLSDSIRMNPDWPKIDEFFSEDIVMPARVVRSKGAREIGYQIAFSFEESTDHEKISRLGDFLQQVKKLD